MHPRRHHGRVGSPPELFRRAGLEPRRFVWRYICAARAWFRFLSPVQSMHVTGLTWLCVCSNSRTWQLNVRLCRHDARRAFLQEEKRVGRGDRSDWSRSGHNILGDCNSRPCRSDSTRLDAPVALLDCHMWQSRCGYIAYRHERHYPQGDARRTTKRKVKAQAISARSGDKERFPWRQDAIGLRRSHNRSPRDAHSNHWRGFLCRSACCRRIGEDHARVLPWIWRPCPAHSICPFGGMFPMSLIGLALSLWR